MMLLLGCTRGRIAYTGNGRDVEGEERMEAAFTRVRRPSHRQAKKDECRQAIARSAVQLFEAKGFDATTMDEIALRAGVSRPTVFNYFARKEDILMVLAQMMAGYLEEACQTFGPPEEHAEPLEAIRRMILIMASAFAEYPETSRAFHMLRMQEMKRRRDQGQTISEEDAPMREERAIIEALIRRAQALGQVRTDYVPAELTRHLMIGLFSSTIGPWSMGAYGSEPLADVVGRTLNLYFTGMCR